MLSLLDSAVVAKSVHQVIQFNHSVVSDSLQPHEPQHAKPMSVELVMPSNHLILCGPLLLLPSSGSFQMSQLFASGGQSIGVSVSASPSKEYSGLIFFRMDWLDLLAVQGTLKSLLQHNNSKASFFCVQLSL